MGFVTAVPITKGDRRVNDEENYFAAEGGSGFADLVLRLVDRCVLPVLSYGNVATSYYVYSKCCFELILVRFPYVIQGVFRDGVLRFIVSRVLCFLFRFVGRFFNGFRDFHVVVFGQPIREYRRSPFLRRVGWVRLHHRAAVVGRVRLGLSLARTAVVFYADVLRGVQVRATAIQLLGEDPPGRFARMGLRLPREGRLTGRVVQVVRVFGVDVEDFQGGGAVPYL